jgi:hypothetical protein
MQVELLIFIVRPQDVHQTRPRASWGTSETVLAKFISIAPY